MKSDKQPTPKNPANGLQRYQRRFKNTGAQRWRQTTDQKTWRNLILSTGEINPESLIGDRAQWKAGNHVRLPDIQAEARYGIYDTLHGFADGAKLSEHINQATAKQRGTAGRALSAKSSKMEKKPPPKP